MQRESKTKNKKAAKTKKAKQIIPERIDGHQVLFKCARDLLTVANWSNSYNITLVPATATIATCSRIAAAALLL